jgi:hypothetical protein
MIPRLRRGKAQIGDEERQRQGWVGICIEDVEVVDNSNVEVFSKSFTGERSCCFSFCPQAGSATRPPSLHLKWNKQARSAEQQFILEMNE